MKIAPFSIALVASAALALIQAPAAAEASSNEVFAASNGGGESCSSAAPCTLEGARAKARTLDSATVVLKDGTYRLSKTFALTEEDSGTTYRAEHAHQAVLDGGLPVSGWTSLGGGVWEAELPQGTLPFHDLFADGVAQTLVRFPNVESAAVRGPWLRLDPALQPVDAAGRSLCVPPTAEKAEPCDRVVSAKDLPGGIDALQGAQFVSQGQWRYKELNIASATSADGENARIGFSDNDSGNGGVIIGSGSWYGTRAGFHQGSYSFVADNTEPDAPYFFQGKREFLDAVGEWHYDAGTRKLRYVSGTSTAPASGSVVVPQIETLISVDNAHDVSLEDLSFRYSNWAAPAQSGYVTTQTTIADWTRSGGPLPAAVRFSGTTRASFVGNRVRATAATGVLVRGNTRDVTVTDNDLQRIGASGVMLFAGTSARSASYPDTVSGAAVADNVIRDVGVHYSDAGGIVGTAVCGTRVEHNDISGSGQSGIALGLFTLYDTDAADPDKLGTAFDRCAALAPDAGPNAIVGNRIGASMRLLSDGGGIYVFGKMPGMRIADNLISGLERSPWAGGNPLVGIYLDGTSQQMTIEHNVLDLPAWTRAFFAGNGGNHGNIFKDNVYTSNELGDIVQSVDPRPCDVPRATCFNPLPKDNVKTTSGGWGQIAWAPAVVQAAGLTAAAKPEIPLVVNTPSAAGIAFTKPVKDSEPVTVSGTGKPGQTIRVLGKLSGDDRTAPVTVGADGRWKASFLTAPGGSPGEQFGFRVRSYDSEDTPKSSPSDSRELLVRLYTAPAVSPSETVYAQLEQLSGTGHPGAAVTVQGERSGKILGRATVDQDGTWTVVFTGAALPPASAPYPLIVDQRVNEMRISRTYTKVQVDAARLTTAPSEGGVTWSDEEVVFEGNALSNAEVRLIGGTHGTEVASGRSNDKGEFRLTATHLPPQGAAYSVRVVVTSDLSGSIELGRVSFFRSELTTPAEGAVVPEAGQAFTGYAPANSSVEIWDSALDTLVASGTADGNGRFALHGTVDLAPQNTAGSVHVVVKVNGATIGVSPDRSFTRSAG